MIKKGIFSQGSRRIFIRFSVCFLLTLALLGSSPSSIGQSTTSDITIWIDILRSDEGYRISDKIQVALLPSLTPIVNSSVLVNSTRTPINSVEGRNRLHSGLFPTAVQNIKIYIQKKGELSLPGGKDLKPNVSAVIDVPDSLALSAPPAESSTTQPLGDVMLHWISSGPVFPLEVRVFEPATNIVVFNRRGIKGDRIIIPASTFAAGKRYCFQVFGSRKIGGLSGSYAPSSRIRINTYAKFFITFTAK